MKKLVLILSLIFLFSSCVTIDERYTGKKVRLEPEEQNDDYSYNYYAPYYYHFSPYYYNPFYRMGFYWGYPYFFWSPYFYYSFYDYYSRYYYGYYWDYPYYLYPRFDRTVITKNRFKKGTIRKTLKRHVRRIPGRIKISGRRGSTVSRMGLSIRPRATVSSRGSSSRIRKKK